MNRANQLLRFALVSIIFQLFSFLSANAQEERCAALPLTGMANQIAIDSSNTVEDTVFFNLSLRPTQTTYRVQNTVIFKLNEFANLVIPDSFKVTITFKAYYSKLVGTSVVLDSTPLQTLAVEYNKLRAYQNKAVFKFTGGYRSQVKIKSVTSNLGTFSAYKDVLMLENEIVILRNYNFDPNTNTIQAISGILGSLTDEDSCSSAGEYIVSWGKIKSATEYDLEWTYIDSTAIENYYQTNTTTIDPVKIFKNNATRVTVTSESYQVPLLYDNGGILYYRVRPVQTRITGQRVEGQWSSFYTPAGLGVYGFAGHERALNWQASTSFAEEGKRKSVVQYFDGTLKSRQTVTKDNNTCYTIVAESMYDYQGRPQIQVLPAPTTNRLISYTPAFNRVNSTNPYDKTIFDADASPADNNCSSVLPGMDISSGASKYYSPNNPFVNNGMNQFIPDARLFPFTETRYTPDNTGRIAMQGGVGREFQINYTGSDNYSHETKYFYSSADQEELDALFGTEVGNASHYSKNMVRDANGQYSVSYVDMHGRTIATALAGKPLAKLDSLQSGNYKLITKKLLDTTTNLVAGTSIIASKNLLVTRPGDHRFQYSLATDSITVKACDNSSICYDCLYDLEITISNDCANPGDQPITIIRTNYSGAAPVDTLCNPITTFPSVDTSIYLSEGSYTITKTLQISPSALVKYNEIFLRRNTCRTMQQIIDSVKNAFLSGVQCAPTCQSCTDSLGTIDNFRNRYMINNGIPPADSASFREQALLAYQAQLEQCNQLCEATGLHTSIRQQMLADMTPPYGQYAELDHFTEFLNIFHSNNDNLNDCRYKTLPAAAFKNESGQQDAVVNSSGLKVEVTHPTITPLDFVNNWKSTWAEALLPLHPEYCKLQKMESYAASYAWDERFSKIETYQQAVDSGFLNPAAYTQSGSGSQSAKTLPSTAPLFSPPALAARDPFAAVEPTGAAQLKDLLFNYMQNGASYINAWSMATIMAHCPDSDMACVSLWNNISTAFTLDTSCSGELDYAWKYFREIYLNKKAELIDGILNGLQCNGSNYITPENTLNFNPIQPGDANTDMPANDAAGRDSLNSFVNGNCEAYVTQWMNEMKPCNLTSADSLAIIPRLIAVCKAGGDMDHPFGSSTTKPGTVTTVGSYHDSTFVQVLQSVLGARYDSTCNAFLLTAPQPYGYQPAYDDVTVYKKPDSCQCSKINTYYTQFQQSTIDPSFADFIYRKTGTRMYPGVLDSLRMLCNGQITCSFLKTALVIPPALQCNTGAPCQNCVGVNAEYNNFKIAFPGIAPSYTDTDSFQINRNRLFANYMNYKLGLGKSCSEYLSFMDDCAGTGLSAACDSLQYILNNYNKTSKPGLVTTALSIRTVMSPPASVTYNDLSTLMDNGTLHYPDSVRNNSSIWYNGYGITMQGGKTFCTSGGFEVEVRFKFFSNNVTGDLFYLGMGIDSALTIQRRTSGLTGILLNYGAVPATYVLSTDPNAHLNWMKIRIKRNASGFSFYFNDLLIFTKNIANTVPNFGGFGLSVFRNLQLCVDWIKVKDNQGVVKYFEDYTNPVNPAFVDSSFVCPATSCTSAFTSYFNTQKGTSYTYAQIDSLYMLKCGKHPEPCTADSVTGSLMLCPSPNPVFEAAAINDLTPCTDSTLFSVGTGTKLYNAYKDSLAGSFNNRYFDKCLKARYSENFTVTAPTSEFHYTLYYYDQAGNLVKTIPPEGVDVSKMGDTVFGNSVKAARASGTLLTPTHTLASQYRYNSLNAVITQITPDAGISIFCYDLLARLTISQNAKQKAAGLPNDSASLYSYTLYDNLGRISSVGQFRNMTTIPASYWLPRSSTYYGTTGWFNINQASRHQITRTVYDIRNTGLTNYIVQKNLRNRVSYTTYTDTVTENSSSATLYSYDIAGNVDTLLQDFGIAGTQVTNNIMNMHNINSNRWKRVVYQYDLVSGKVNHVAYQPPRNGVYFPDALYHRYSYDAENRLTLAETSTDSVIWEKDARYNYYLHGPLARTTLGHQLVQGIDYAYTLQGWLKGVNAINLSDPGYDMGNDGKAGTANQYTAKDAFGFNLNYFLKDFLPVKSGVYPFPDTINVLGTSFKPLYNGNISSMAVNIAFPNATAQQVPQLYAYTYDQLNRIVGMDVYRHAALSTNNSWNGMSLMNDYKERVQYDANGNILKYLRQGYGANTAMDNLTYNYTYASGRLVNNRLDHVRDTIGASAAHSSNYTEDIDDQAAGNYNYDAAGNLIQDTKEGITNIEWNVYGKIKRIYRTADANNPVTKIEYSYNAAGERVLKAVTKGAADSVEYTAYARDAGGNIMATYFAKDAPNGTVSSAPPLLLKELNLYGSSRIGVLNNNIVVSTAYSNPAILNFVRGNKFFELNNHLQNVLVTISDKKIGVSSNGTTVDYYTADVISAQDYYPFGMQMTGRKFTQANSSYRYGFNGKENDNDVKGTGNQQNYGMRIYDPRIGKFLSVDPLTRSYPWYTPYQFAGNKPIACIDLDGLEELWITNNAFAPFDLFGSDGFGSYSGDGENRKFGDGGTYRTSGTAHINITTSEPPTFVAGNTTSTYHRNFFGEDYTHESPSKIEETDYYHAADNNFHQLQMHVAGSNGAVIFNAAPAIDAHVNIYLEKNSQDKTKVLVHGYVQGDKFPANETILTDKNGNKLVLGVSGPMSGKNIGPYKDLFGDFKRDMYSFRMTVIFNDDETIKGVELNGKQYSIADWNKMFSNLNPKSTTVSTTTNNENGTTEIKEEE